MPCAQGRKPEPLSVELSGPIVSVILTQGSISIWFGKKANKALIAKMLIIISKVDSTTEHEKEVLCNFGNISEFENDGYVLTSYAKKSDKYRAVFVVPFSNPRALDRFIESLSKEIADQDIKITLYWRGGRTKMNILSEELEGLGCFTNFKINYKDDQL